MKKCIPFFCLLVTTLSAQEAPKKDPFIKDKKPAAPPPAEQVTNITFLQESFILPQADFATWLDVPGGREQLHEKVLATVKAGTAKLDACHFARGRSGFRFTLESVDELHYPTEWSTADEKGFQYPVAFEMKPTGDRFEVEPVIDQDSKLLSVNLSTERVRFNGLRPVKADSTLPGLVVADFYEQRSPTCVNMQPGLPTLVSSHTRAGQVTLTFLTPRVIPVQSAAQVSPPEEVNITLTSRIISLSRQSAWELLQKHAGDDAALLAALKPMMADQSAVLEHVSTIMSRSGQRSQHESVHQLFYGTEFSAPTAGTGAKPADDPKKPSTAAQPPAQASTKSFDSRRIGFNWETDTILDEKQKLIDTNIMFEHTAFAGNLADPLWSEHYPDYPVFTCQKIVTWITHAPGSTVLLSTLSPPGDTGVNGRKDEGRVWLLFLEES